MATDDIGVVLVNLGTPASPALRDVQTYLREFLSDRRIVPLSPVIWRPILELSVLHGHAKLSAAKYASIWTPDGSPLLLHTQAQQKALAEHLPGVRVAYAMRYGQPSFDSVLGGLYADGIRRLLIVPMYPQFSTTTVATVFDAMARYLLTCQDQFEYRTIRTFHDDAGYIEAAAQRVEATWAHTGRPDFASGDKLLLSFHGIPVFTASADPYPSECERTATLLRARLGLDADVCPMTYQSKFGRGAWLTPATIDTVAKLGESGTKRLDVFCPGFTADCLETEEEIGLLNRDAFLAYGGQQFVRIPCLNDSAPWMDALAAIVRTHLSGWVD